MLQQAARRRDRGVALLDKGDHLGQRPTLPTRRIMGKTKKSRQRKLASEETDKRPKEPPPAEEKEKTAAPHWSEAHCILKEGSAAVAPCGIDGAIQTNVKTKEDKTSDMQNPKEQEAEDEDLYEFYEYPDIQLTEDRVF